MRRGEGLSRIRDAAERIWSAKTEGGASSPQFLRDQSEVLTVTLEAIYRFLSVDLTGAFNPDYDRARHEAKWLVWAARRLVSRQPGA